MVDRMGRYGKGTFLRRSATDVWRTLVIKFRIAGDR